MCLSQTRRKFLESMANTPGKKTWYQGKLGGNRSAMITAETIAALGKNSGLPRNFKKKKSEPIVAAVDRNSKNNKFVLPA